MNKKKICRIAGIAVASVAIVAGGAFYGMQQLGTSENSTDGSLSSMQSMRAQNVSTSANQHEVTLHFKWEGSQPHVAYSVDETNTATTNPGVPMNDEGNGWYTYTIKNAEEADVVISVPEMDYTTSEFSRSEGEYWYDLDAGWNTSTPDNYEEPENKEVQGAGAEEEITKDAEEVAAESKIIVHYTSDWENTCLYAWNALPNDIEMDWPGKELKKDADGYFSYTFDATTKVNFLFTGDGTQTEDYSLKKAGEYWYSNGKWVTEKPSGDQKETPAPDETVAPDKTPGPEESSGPSSTPAPFTRTDFRDETIYFMMTSRFYDGDSSNNCVSWRDTGTDDNKNNPGNAADDPVWRGDFKGVVEKLDYIKALGFSAIWITPVVKNASDYDYHGYHAINHSKVDVRYESKDCTYQDLINACHKKGIKVIQDIVLNHCSDYGEENLFPAFTRTDDISKLDKSTTALTLTDLGKSIGMTDDFKQNEAKRCAALKNDTSDPDRIFHHEKDCTWEGYTVQTGQMGAHCVDLNTENPKVTKYLTKCYTDFIGMGVDAFRIDTIKHVSRLSFNSAFLPAFKEAGGENFYMFGEACVRRNEVWNAGIPPISVPFYTWKESSDYGWDSSETLDATLNNEKLVAKHYQDNLNTGTQPTSDNAFLNGNDYHKPDRSKSSGLDMIDFYMHWQFKSARDAFSAARQEDSYFNDSTWNVMYVDSHDYGPDSFNRYEGSQAQWAENLDLIFTFRGIPCIYYGSEIEFKKGEKIDDWQNALEKSGRAYFGDHIEGSVNTTDYAEYNGATGEMAKTLEYPLAKHIQRLNKIRRAVPALRKGQYSTEGISGGGMAYKRRYTDSTTDSFVCVTISGDATFSGIPSGTYVDMVTGDKVQCNGTLTASCSGQGNMRVYVLQTSGAPNGKVGEDGTYLK